MTRVNVVAANEQDEVAIDLERWSNLAAAVLAALHRTGELTLTFVDRDEIATLNQQHLGGAGPTDVLSFPLDDEPLDRSIPTLLGDIVICPAVAAENAPDHAGNLVDELALLIVHGLLHLFGYDHAAAGEAAAMQAQERRLLESLHWHAATPIGFSYQHRTPPAAVSEPGAT